MSAAAERDEILHDMAGMVQVLDMGCVALELHQSRSEQRAIIAECREAITRLRAQFARLAALYRADASAP